MTKDINKAGMGKKSADKKATEEEIRVAAYYCWLERENGGASGSELDDWMEAENKWRDNIFPARND